MIGEELIGKLFKYNDILSKIEKKERKDKVIYTITNCDYFGEIKPNSYSLKFRNQEEVDSGINKVEVIDSLDNIKLHLINLGIEPKWYIIDSYCATLIKLDGNPNNVEDRVAFIEKTPRIYVNNEWIYGPKGDGHECGFYEPSRNWIIENFLNINELNNDLNYNLDIN